MIEDERIKTIADHYGIDFGAQVLDVVAGFGAGDPARGVVAVGNVAGVI